MHEFADLVSVCLSDSKRRPPSMVKVFEMLSSPDSQRILMELRKAHAKLDQLDQKSDQGQELQRQLANTSQQARKNIFPSLCIMLPEDQDTTEFWELFKKLDNLIKIKARVHFLCEFQCTTEGIIHKCWHRSQHSGVVISNLKDSIKTLAKAVRGTLLVMKAASRVAKALGVNVSDEVDSVLQSVETGLETADAVATSLGAHSEQKGDQVAADNLPRRMTEQELSVFKHVIKAACQEQKINPGDLDTGSFVFDLHQVCINREGPHGREGSYFYCENHAKLAERWNAGEFVGKEQTFIDEANEIEPFLFKEPELSSLEAHAVAADLAGSALFFSPDASPKNTTAVF